MDKKLSHFVPIQSAIDDQRIGRSGPTGVSQGIIAWSGPEVGRVVGVSPKNDSDRSSIAHETFRCFSPCISSGHRPLLIQEPLFVGSEEDAICYCARGVED